MKTDWSEVASLKRRITFGGAIASANLGFAIVMLVMDKLIWMSIHLASAILCAHACYLHCRELKVREWINDHYNNDDSDA